MGATCLLFICANTHPNVGHSHSHPASHSLRAWDFPGLHSPPTSRGGSCSPPQPPELLLLKLQFLPSVTSSGVGGDGKERITEGIPCALPWLGEAGSARHRESPRPTQSLTLSANHSVPLVLRSISDTRAGAVQGGEEVSSQPWCLVLYLHLSSSDHSFLHSLLAYSANAYRQGPGPGVPRPCRCPWW